MKKIALAVAVVLVAYFGRGWMVQHVMVPSKGLENARTFDPADYENITVDENVKSRLHLSLNLDCKEQVTVPLVCDNGSWHVALVTGEINGRSYPFVFDTGCSLGLCVQDVHVRESDLAVYFANDEDGNNSSGLVLVENLRIGELQLNDFPCVLLEKYMQVRVMGLPVKRSRYVLMPLGLMKEFRYFRFDRLDDKLVFDANEPFTVEDESEWIKFPFEITKEKRLLLTVPLGGVDVVWFVDTGDPSQLTIDESTFDKFIKVRPELEEERQYREVSFSPYAGGMKEGKAIDVDELMFGEHGIEDVRVVYQADDVFGELPYQGVMGFGLFEDTVMVLDFERNLMWVKKAGKFAV